MTARSPATPVAAGFCMLASRLDAIAPKTLQAYSTGLAALDRGALVELFRLEFGDGRRERAFVLSEQLTAIGIPPCFRHYHLSSKQYSESQKADLLIYDARWLRAQYPKHHERVRYPKYKLLLVGSEREFHFSANHAFRHDVLKDGDRGKLRSTCEVVRMLSLSDAMQYDCMVLHSAHVKKRIDATGMMRDRVYAILKESVGSIRKTSCFDKDKEKETLSKRHKLWLASRLTDDGSPTQTAARYAEMTGETLTRFAVRDQLDKVKKTLKEDHVTFT
jgi:hypothetical protein